MAETLLELDGVPLGLALTFDPGDSTVRDSDVLMSSGVFAHGRDVVVPPLWTFDLLTQAAGPAEARALVAQWNAAWRPASLSSPGAVSSLRYRVDGRWRRVFGRPRGFRGPGAGGVDGGPLAAGLAVVTGTFQATDPLHYGDAAQRVQIGSVPASTGGLLAPLVAPLSTLRSGTPDTRFVTVGGDAPTPLTVTFRGPIAQPWVRLGPLRVALTGTLAYDQAVTIDARMRTVLWSAGRSGSAAGLLDPRARLAGLVLKPGRHEVQFGGTDQTGTATCEVSWRDAWRSL